MAISKFSNSTIGNGFPKLTTFWDQVSIFGITGGNEIKTVGSYRYHFFTSNGSLVVPTSTNLQIISCGGGGGGGQRIAGGGGAGELDILTAVNSAVGTYTVTVGSGGSGSLSDSVKGSTGGTSTFALGGTTYVSSLGGGGGGSGDGSNDGAAGGSGGGGSFYGNPGTGGAASGSNTNAGGNGISDRAGGGGGGATAAGNPGTTVNTNPNSQGGEGYTLTTIDSNLTAANFTSLTGMTVICSGGGGARFGAVGGTSVAVGGTGGGNGAFGTTPTPATNATSYGSGGGGGAWENPRNGANGFPGLVIVRYSI